MSPESLSGQNEKDSRESYSERESIRIELTQRVQNFTSEQLKAPEKREHIMDAVTNGLDLIATDIVEEAELEGKSVQETSLTKLWPITDFARTALTYPLPGQTFEYEDMEAPLEAEVADEQDWWRVLSREQKQALSNVVGLDLTKVDTFTPPPNEQDRPHVIERAQNPLVLADGSEILPMLIWNPHDGPGLTAVPKEQNE
jgi:hypothetical protein